MAPRRKNAAHGAGGVTVSKLKGALQVQQRHQHGNAGRHFPGVGRRAVPERDGKQVLLDQHGSADLGQFAHMRQPQVAMRLALFEPGGQAPCGEGATGFGIHGAQFRAPCGHSSMALQPAAAIGYTERYCHRMTSR